MSYRRLDGWAVAGAHALSGRGVVAGSRCALVLSDPFALLTWLLGCDRLGATAVLVDPAWPAALRSAALDSVTPAAVVDTTLEEPEVTGLGAVGGFTNDGPGDGRLDIAGEGDTRFLAAFTSGTTGAPRAIVRSRRSWTASFAPFTQITGIADDAVVLIPGPLHSTLFLFGALHALAAGATVLLAPVSTTEPWTAAHLVPALLTDLVRQPGSLAGRTVVCAGAALPSAVADTAADRGLRVVEYYGAAELSFVAAGPPGEMRAFPGIEVEVRAEDGRSGCDGPGRIWVRSSYLSDGYLGGVEGPYRLDDQGFATVGDVGQRSPTGTLTILGRGDGLVLTGGVAVLPEDIEASLRGATGVNDLVVVATPHNRLGQVVNVVVEPSETVPTLADLRARASDLLAPAQRPRRWWLMAHLPRTPSGKVARGEVSRGLADGTLDASPLR